MSPGIELDKLIAEKIFGFSKSNIDGIGRTCNRRNDENQFYLRPYSTDIATAWSIVEKLSEDNFLVQTRTFIKQPWQSTCLILKEIGTTEDKWIVEIGESVPHAICKAALKAAGYDFK